MAASIQPSATVTSKYVEGTTLYDLHGKQIGIGHSHRPVPWSGLHYDAHLNGYRIDPSASETLFTLDGR